MPLGFPVRFAPRVYVVSVPLNIVPNGAEPDPAHPWEDASSFHTKTRESTTVSITVRLPQTTARAIAKAVQSGKFPEIETNSDAVRDGMWRWCRWIAHVTHDEEMARQLDVQRAQWRLEGELEKLNQLSNTVETAEKLLDDDSHGESTKRRVLRELSDLVLRIEDSGLRLRAIELIAKHRQEGTS